MSEGDLRTRPAARPLIAAPAARAGEAEGGRDLLDPGDFVRNVGGDRVVVDALVGPNGDAHVYQPSPADAKTLADARLVFVNGLGFEGWIDAPGQGVRHQGADVVATKGVKPRKAGGRSRPRRGRSACLAVGRERQDLCRQHPRRADRGRSGRQGQSTRPMPRPISAKLDALDTEVRAAIAKIPPDRRRIITTHDAFGYFERRLRGRRSSRRRASRPKPRPPPATSPASSRRSGSRRSRRCSWRTSPTRGCCERIAAETGATIGGTLYSDALTDAERARRPPTST